jgi:TolA-binding protein
LPVRLHVKEQPKAFERFKAKWTPTLALLDSEGNEQYRIEGFLPADKLLARLQLGVAKAAFQRGQFADAEKHFRTVHEQYPDSEAAPEAIYWGAVAAYKATGSFQSMGPAGKLLQEKYPQSEWAQKGSVWVR